MSLTLCVAKMESMLLARLIWFPESRKLIAEAMLGFLVKLSSFDCILDFTGGLEHRHQRKKNTSTFFLDMKKAYDNVISAVVIRRLRELGNTGTAHLFVRDFFSNCSLRFRLGKVLGERRTFAGGLPQSCV